MTALSDTPASTVADLGPTTANDTVVDCPFRQAVGGVMSLNAINRTRHRQCCKSSGPSLRQSVREASEGGNKYPCLPKFDAGSRDNVHEGGGAIAVDLHRC